ncbi:MAG: ABC transporter ATP-binding protein [Ruminococcaceae bacterium]|nr:ABC transporter ATP-binding protein [Oscillospiraceae bacterium]
MSKNPKEKKKKLSFKRNISNNLFALKTIWIASPLYLFVYLSSSVLYGALDFLSGTYLLRKIVNGISNGDPIANILMFTAILGTVTLITYTSLQWFWNVTSQKMHRKISIHIQKMVFKKAATVELACYETPSFYDKYVKAMDEAQERIIKVMRTLDGLIQKFTALFANSLLLFIIDPVLILFGLFPLLLGFFRRLENITAHKYKTEKKPLNRRKEYVLRTFYLSEYAKEMRIGSMHENMLRDFRESIHDFCTITKKYGTRKAIFGYIRKVGLEVVTVLGATLYAVWSNMVIGPQNGGMNVGDCIVVIGSIGTISYCLNNLIQNFAEFGEHALFLEDMRFFLDYEPTIVDGALVAPGSGEDITVKNVSFQYDGAAHDTLKNISFTLRKGERIALVGSNGAGKTTLIKLMLRLYDPKEGEIMLGDKNIKDFSLSSYRNSFSTVFQDFKMFSMSVKDNVLLRPEKGGDRELVENALRESGAMQRIERMENGIDTVLTREFDKKGENLSVGEQQKLSLARIFGDSTPYVILDEPSSALDPIAEYKMFENMMRATEGRSVIFISHRLSSAVLADRILLMENGSITESGTHRELIDQNGKYAEMFRRQAQNYLGSEVSSDAQ